MPINMTRGDTRLIIDECNRAGLLRNQCAYVLATAWHETGATMKPVRETFAKTDAGAKAALTKAFKAGKLKGVVRDYWSGGFYGRGYPQVTHEPNYARASKVVGVDLVKFPDRMMEPAIAVAVMLDGMTKGWFRTGHTLARYLTIKNSDFYGAREIINGDKRSNGEMVAAYAREYDAALKREGYGVSPESEAKPKIPPVPVFAATRSVVQDVQAALWNMGFTEVGSRKPNGTFDGVPGKLTETAILAFRNERGLTPSPAIDRALIDQLAQARAEKWRRAIPLARAMATETEVAAKVPEVKVALRTRVAAGWTAVTTGAGTIGYGVLTNLASAKAFIDPVRQEIPDIPTWAFVATVAVAAGLLWWWSSKGATSGVERWQEGASR